MGNCCSNINENDYDETDALLVYNDITDIFERSNLIQLINQYLKKKDEIVHIGIYFSDGNVTKEDVIEPLIQYMKIFENEGQHVIITDKTYGNDDKYFLYPINTINPEPNNIDKDINRNRNRNRKRNKNRNISKSYRRPRTDSRRPFFIFVKITNFYIPYQYGRQILYQTRLKSYYRQDICVICEDNNANVLYNSCGHLQICLKCQINQKDPTYSTECQGRFKCPICNSHAGIKDKDWIVLSKDELEHYYPLND